nr:DNA-binding transcriptional regulator [Ramlibacter agri]
MIRRVTTSPPVRSVARAIQLLQALNRQPVSTVDVLHAHTRFPKSTIVRMLRTFESLGIVRHAPQHGAYFLTSGVRTLSSGYHSEPMVVEAAAPLMDALTVRVGWPTALAVLEGSVMVVRYSTIPLSPLALRHSTINMKLSLASRAMGRAFLAFCAPEQQDALLEMLAASAEPEDQPARAAASLRALLSEVRQAGYATRDPQAGPASNTLAVPVFDRHGVAASLGLTFFASTMKPEQAVEKFLPDLQEVAQQVSARLQDLQAQA